MYIGVGRAADLHPTALAALRDRAVNLAPSLGKQGLKAVGHAVAQRARHNAPGIVDAHDPPLSAIVLHFEATTEVGADQKGVRPRHTGSYWCSG